MAFLGKIRRMYYRDKLSLSEIARLKSLSRNFLRPRRCWLCVAWNNLRSLKKPCWALAIGCSSLLHKARRRLSARRSRQENQIRCGPT